MVLGGAGLVASAWLPAYIVLPKPVYDYGPGGALTIRGLPAQELSPWEVGRDKGPLAAAFILIPHLFGLSILLAHLFEPVGRRLAWFYHAIAVITILPAAGGTIVAGIAALVYGFGGLGWGPTVAAGFGAVALAMVCVATMRAMSPEMAAAPSPRLRSLIHQGISCFFVAGWLLLVATIAAKVMPLHAVAMPALGLLLVGTHLAARAELRARAEPS
jgi:hypothetical protein